MARKKSGNEVRHLLAILVALSIVCPTGFALAGQHTWDVNEVFSNADGTIQFVELWEAGGLANEGNVGLNPLSAKSPTKSFTIGGVVPLAPSTANRFFLLGTKAFQALPGAPPVDATIPDGVLPFFFNPAGATVTFGVYDSFVFGAIPTDGLASWNDGKGGAAFSALNSPTNYAGTSGSVDASPPPLVPSTTSGALLVGLGLMMAAGIATLLWRRQSASA